MLQLPSNLPQPLRSDLEQSLSGKTFQYAAGVCAEKIAQIIGARDAIFFLSSQSQVAEEQEIRQCRSLRENASAANAEQLLAAWLKPGVHENVMQQLSSRSSAVSYSSFSWPYAHIFDEGDSKKCLLPKDYTVFIPISSSLIVTAEGDIQFAGYVALMFDSFPQLDAEAVEMLIFLPALLSEIMSTYLRKVPPYAHHLLALRDGVARHQEVLEDMFATLQHGRTKDRIGALNVINNSCQALVENAKASGYLLHQRGKKATVHLQSLAIDELVLRELDILRPIGQKIGISIDANVGDSAQEAYVDPTLFPSMLYNLLAHSLTICAQGDNISIVCRKENPETIQLSISATHLSRANSEWDSPSPHRKSSSHSLLIANEIAQVCKCAIREELSGTTSTFTIEVPTSTLLSSSNESDALQPRQ